MNYDEQPLWIRMLDDWLMGMTIDERIKGFQQGKLEMCVKCGEVFYDKEMPGERYAIDCFTPYSKHDWIELENYIILKRSFRGVVWIAIYPDHVSVEDAICAFFKKRAMGKLYENGRPSRFRF